MQTVRLTGMVTQGLFVSVRNTEIVLQLLLNWTLQTCIYWPDTRARYWMHAFCYYLPLERKVVVFFLRTYSMEKNAAVCQVP